MGDPAAGAGRGAHHLPAGVVELVEAHEQQVGEVARERRSVGRALSRPAEPARTDELLGEERVALGALHDPGDVALVDRAGLQRADEAADHVVGQRGQLHPQHSGEPRPLGDDRAKRMAPVQVVGAVGPDDGDGRPELPGQQEAHEVPGGAVCPVEVLEDHEHRAFGAQRLEGSVHAGEDRRTVDGLVGAWPAGPVRTSGAGRGPAR